MFYENYFLEKYKKYIIENGKSLALVLIIIFVIDKLICYLLINLINKKNKTNQLSNKKILFIEPVKQGFGDLLFQTSLFKSWTDRGFTVDILLSKKEHMDIIKNNPYINKVFIWNINDLFKILTIDYAIIFSLCRNSIKENFLLVLKISSNKILPDLNLVLWKRSFSADPNTIAWQNITNKITPELNPRGIPQLFFSELEKECISQNRKNKIVIIAGMENQFKKISLLENILLEIPKKLLNDIILVGKNKNNIQYKLPIKNLINKLTYRETIIEIAGAKFVFGPESSLVHIASVLGIKTAVWDPEKNFIKNSHPSLSNANNLSLIYNKEELKNIINYINLSSQEN